MRRIACLIAALGAAAALAAPPPELKPGHPQRYTVQKGDTLWGIAARFLKDPWRWKDLWKANPAIRDPNLIYPGDVLVLEVGADGRPRLKALRAERLQGRVVKLSPAIRELPLKRPIPTLPAAAIEPFLSRPLVVEPGDLADSGYVTGGMEDRILLGKYSRFYARGVQGAPGDRFHLFRTGEVLRDPDSGEPLGQQALYLGSARLERPGDLAVLEITSASGEIEPGDRLLPAPPAAPPPVYEPRPPETEIRGRILAALGGVVEVGSHQVVVINRGRREGLAPGHVLRILNDPGPARDPVTGKSHPRPLDPSGVLMVFRAFEKLSYGLVMESTRAVHVGDVVATPE